MEPDALPQPSPKPVSVQEYGFFSHWRELLNQINLRHSVRQTYGQAIETYLHYCAMNHCPVNVESARGFRTVES